MLVIEVESFADAIEVQILDLQVWTAGENAVFMFLEELPKPGVVGSIACL